MKNILFSLMILAVCILFFAKPKTNNALELFNTNGDRMEFKNVNNFVKNSDYQKKDSSKNKGKSSLDGDQNIVKPKLDAKQFDPNAPFTKLTFRMLRTYIPGKQLPEDLKKLNDENVEILGFMTPLNALENMDEFLLCSAPPLNCYCAPPIFINEIIYVKLIDKRTDFKTGAVRIKGQFHINLDIKDEYSDIIYSINASDIE